jgi:hypothetical protein
VLSDTTGVYGNCFDDVDPTEMYADCVFDHCADPDAACDMLQLYEAECAAAGEHNYTSVVDGCGVCGGNGSSCASTVVVGVEETITATTTTTGVPGVESVEESESLGGGAIAGIVVGTVAGVVGMGLIGYHAYLGVGGGYTDADIL